MLKKRKTQSYLFFALSVSLFLSCKPGPIAGPGEDNSSLPTNPSVEPKAEQLTGIKEEGEGGLTKITYGANKNPLQVIMTTTRGELVQRDSCIYNVQGKLLKVITYGQPLPNGKPLQIRTSVFELDSRGNIARKVVTTPSVSGALSTTVYGYDSQNKVIRMASLLKGEKDSLIAKFDYGNDRNVRQVTGFSGKDILYKLKVSGYDGHPSYSTNPLLPYLILSGQGEEFSEQNVLEKTSVTYVNINSKKDSIVTLTKNSYQYNTVNLPVKQVASSVTTSNGNTTNTTLTTSLSYGK